MDIFSILCAVIIIGGLIAAIVKKKWIIFGIAFPVAMLVLGFGDELSIFDALTASTFTLMIVLLIYNYQLSRKLEQLDGKQTN